MKINIYIYALVAAQLLLFSCKKKKDNLTYSPSVTAGFPSGKLIASGGNYTIPFTIKAPGEIEQVDFKVWGSTYTVTNKNNVAVDLSTSVPYDWVGLRSIRTGFDDSENFLLNVNLTGVTAKTTITVQVIDKNNFKISTTMYVLPVTEGLLNANQTVYTQRATAADAGVEADRYLYLGSLNNSKYDTASAKANGTFIDVAFADSASLGTKVILSSPTTVKANSGNAAGLVNITGKATTFLATALDANTATLQQVLDVDMTLSKAYVVVAAGSSYIYKNADGVGIMKVNSISAGGVSTNANAELDITYRYNIIRLE